MPSVAQLASAPMPHRQTCENTRQPAKFTARAIWRQTDRRLAVLRSVDVRFARQTSASLLHALLAPGNIGGLLVQRFRLRCKECARPATLPIVRCAWRRRGRVIDPTSANRNRCPPACRNSVRVRLRGTACTSVLHLAEVSCHTVLMARPRKSRLQCVAASDAAPDDLYDYARPSARRPGRRSPRGS